MKRRILSFILVTVMLFITLSVGFSASSEAENLIKNGDFAEISNNLPTNWKTNLESGTTAEVVKNVSVASGLNTTAMKFTTTTTSTSRSEFYYTGRVKIEKTPRIRPPSGLNPLQLRASALICTSRPT